MWHGRSSLLFKKKWKKTTMSFMQMIKWLSGDLISSRLLLSLPHIDWQIGLPVQRKGYTQLLSATLNHVIYTLWWSHSFTLFSINMPCIQNLHAVWLLCCSADEKKKIPHRHYWVFLSDNENSAYSGVSPYSNIYVRSCLYGDWCIFSQHDTGREDFLCLQENLPEWQKSRQIRNAILWKFNVIMDN